MTRAVFVYTFTRENIDEVEEVASPLVANNCKLTFNVFSSPVGYDGPLRHDAQSLMRTRKTMIELLGQYPKNVLFSVYNAVAHTHEKGLHDLIQLFLSALQSIAGYRTGTLFSPVPHRSELGPLGGLLRAGHGLS